MNKFNKFVIVSHVALFSIILELYRCSNGCALYFHSLPFP